MSIFVVYIKLGDEGLYSFQDFEDKTSWLEIVGNKELAQIMTDVFSEGWVPVACECVYDRVAISTGQSGIKSRVFDLIDEHGTYDFRPLWPQKKAEVVWKEGEKIKHEVWADQDRSKIDFSKITDDLCKGSTGNHYH